MAPNTANKACSTRTLLCCLLVAVFACGSKIQEPTKEMTLEQLGYIIYLSGVENPVKKEYMKLLSPGGRVYFLANRKDYAQALAELEKLPKRDTGSGLYIRAVCLDGLGRHAEAVSAFKQAKEKIDLIFNPGFKFYLQYATALVGAGKEQDCIKMLDTALEKCNSIKGNQNQSVEVTVTVRRRKMALPEKFGRYEQACHLYMMDFGLQKVTLNLDRAPVSNDEFRAKAKALLNKLPPQPPSDMSDDLADYFFKKGQCYLALGQVAEAKKNLFRVLDIHPIEEDYVVANRASKERETQLGRIKASARVLLVRMTYAEKDYRTCCELLRKTLSYDPFDEFSRHYTSIAMKDVPQIVLQSDIAVHHQVIENRLDRSPIEVMIPKRRKVSPDPFARNLTLKKARAKMENRQFAECYQTLNTFMRETMAICAHPRGYAELDKKERFLADTVFRARMLQIGVGLAAGMPYQGLTFNGARPFDNAEQESANLGLQWRHAIDPAIVPNWAFIEDKLTGRSTHSVSALHPEKNSQFVPWCHFAAGLRLLKQKNYKNAQAEFSAVNWKEKPDDDLNAYARVLSQVCKKKLLSP